MLKIQRASNVSQQKEAIITVPTDMSDDDAKRLRSLAYTFYGHHIDKPDSYILTEARGVKCWLLFRHGFEGAGIDETRRGRRFVRHPRDGRDYAIPQALACARLMEPVKPLHPAVLAAVQAVEELA